MVQLLLKKSSIAFYPIILFIIIPLVWEMYCTDHTFGMLAPLFFQMKQNLEGGTFLQWIFFLGTSNLGEQIPLWASAIRLFWWVFIYGLGTIAGLILLLKPKKLSTSEFLITGGLLAAIIFTGAATILAPGGQRFTHFFMFAFFFTIPPLLFLVIKPGRFRNIGFALMVILCFILSFPSFLAHNGNIDTESVYSYEVDSSQFLNRAFGSGKDLTIVEQISVGTEQLYLPDAVAFGGQAWNPTSKEVILQSHTDLLSGFLYSIQGFRVYITSNRMKISAEYGWGISPDDPFWQQLQEKLEGAYTGCIYNNGFVQIWTP